MFGVGMFKLETHPWLREIGAQAAVERSQGAVEQHLLDAHVIMKVFDVADRPRGATWMNVQRWPAMSREWQRTRLTKRGHLKKARDASAASGVGLQDIDRSGRQHSLEVRQVVT